MGGIASKFADSINDELGYFPTWKPNAPIKLGDYGNIDDDIFTKLGNVRTLGVHFTAELGNEADDEEYTSDGSSVIAINAGESGFVNAGLKFMSSSEFGFHFSAKKCFLNEVVEVGDFLDNIKAKFKELNKSLKNISVVTQVLNAETTAVILSRKKNSEFAIEATLPGVTYHDFHDVSGGFSIKSNKNVGYSLVGGKNLTPLYKAIELG
jgi:hypothetical protein